MILYSRTGRQVKRIFLLYCNEVDRTISQTARGIFFCEKLVKKTGKGGGNFYKFLFHFAAWVCYNLICISTSEMDKERKRLFMGIMRKLLGTNSKREVKKITPIVDRIDALADEYKAMSDEALREKTAEFKTRLANGASLDDILPEAFANCREITEIVVVCPEERFHAINGANLETEIPVTRVDGGAERHESVQNGLAALLYTPEFVAVHDGARPLITVEQISRCIQTAREYGASASAHPVTDTLKRADKERFTLPEQVERDGLWCMETPQVFQYPLLLDAYVEVTERNIQVTDEVTALQLIGHPTRLVHNHEPNPKITWPEDISRAEMLMELKHLRNDS